MTNKKENKSPFEGCNASDVAFYSIHGCMDNAEIARIGEDYGKKAAHDYAMAQQEDFKIDYRRERSKLLNDLGGSDLEDLSLESGDDEDDDFRH